MAYTSRRSYRRKPAKKSVRRFRKGGAAPRVSKAVKLQVQRTLKNQLEKKWIGNNLQGAVGFLSGQQVLYACSTVPIGTGGNQRVAEYIRPTNLQLSIPLYSGVPESALVRITVFKTKNDGFQPTGDILGASSGTPVQYQVTQGNLHSLLTVDPQYFDGESRDEGLAGNVTIIRDMWLRPSNVINAARVVKMSIPLTGQLHYTIGGPANGDKGYYLSVSVWSPNVPYMTFLAQGRGQGSNGSAANSAQYSISSRFTYTDA